MGVLAPHLHTLDRSADPPIDTSGNCPHLFGMLIFLASTAAHEVSHETPFVRPSHRLISQLKKCKEVGKVC